MTTIALAALLAAGATSAPRPDPPATPLHHRIDRAIERTHACQALLGVDPSPVSQTKTIGRAYARWVLTLWNTRADAYCSLARELGHPAAAIRAVFGRHADEALAVARCESGVSTHATNGQYLGLFQMGDYARSRYGHGPTPLQQARAAHAYFLASGSDWSPWQCRPSGGLAW